VGSNRDRGVAELERVEHLVECEEVSARREIGPVVTKGASKAK